MHTYRTHTCGEIRKEHVGQQVRVSGWIHSVRDHGGIIFIDLRDHYGLTQVVIDPKQPFYQTLEHWRVETVICFTGEVVARTPETINPRMVTGEIEVVASDMNVLGTCDILPFQIAKEGQYPEHLRLKYRFLDLRRDILHQNIILRSKVISSIRQRMVDHGFLEYQTPILTSSSPEGARDFLVPSRLHPGKFYALPQAPQQFKQLLMVSGFDRYFQIAPCFRDEDARADRSPGEFYQLDLEMSFVTQEDVFAVVEDVFHGLFKEFSEKTITDTPFPRIPYREAMARFGTDKPDLRNPLEMVDVTEVLDACEFKVFANVIKSGGMVKAIVVKGIAGQSRKFFDDMVGFAQSVGAGGLAYITWKEQSAKGPVAKFLSETELTKLCEIGNIEEGDAMFFIADQRAKNVYQIGDQVRRELGQRLGLVPDDCFKFCWIVDFPMYEIGEESGKVEFSHNPFSMPQGGLQALEEKEPLDILAYQYDIVCNGVELSSGAIRNHEPDIMYKAFDIVGHSREFVDEKFGGMIRAFKFGAPPHGGIAPGIDRIVMLLSEASNLREVIAFPLNQQAQDLMMNAPSGVFPEQLRELHIRTVVPKGKKD
jgi:aspartyl-tRNA synthetase